MANIQQSAWYDNNFSFRILVMLANSTIYWPMCLMNIQQSAWSLIKFFSFRICQYSLSCHAGSPDGPDSPDMTCCDIRLPYQVPSDFWTFGNGKVNVAVVLRWSQLKIRDRARSSELCWTPGGASSVGIICSGSDASALGTCALPRTGIFRIGKLQLAYDSIKVV